MAKYIDKFPPRPEDTSNKDTMALYEYLFYLREQINLIVSTMNKGDKNNGK